MGGDGGSIPTRTDLVKIREKKKDTDPLVLVRIGWKYCSMSSQILNEPIVADDLGNLYNKEAVLKYLMSKKPEPQFLHIRNLKDVVTLKLQVNPSLTDADKKDMVKEGEDKFIPRWVCPITRVDTNGKNKFVALRSCGCVMSERGLREVPSSVCLVCAKPYTAADLLPLVPAPNELEEARARMEARRAAQPPASSGKTSKTDNPEKAEKHEKHSPASAGPTPAPAASSASSSFNHATTGVNKAKRPVQPTSTAVAEVPKKPRVDTKAH